MSFGNTYGVAEVDTSDSSDPAAFRPVHHVHGAEAETLWEIAEKHYGKGKGAKYTEIVQANSPPVKNPDMVQPGWVLRTPPLA
nr:LysM peptidoglycan-binding domain-containing protein [Microvirga makkahensis]